MKKPTKPEVTIPTIKQADSKKAITKKPATKKAAPKKEPTKKATTKKSTTKAATKRTVKPKPTPEQKSKAEELVAGVVTLHDQALELAESVLFMADKLKESRAAMKYEPLVVEYDNGGGQSGIRENPHFTAFEKLMATYSKSLDQLTKIIENGRPARKASTIMAELTTIAGRKLG